MTDNTPRLLLEIRSEPYEIDQCPRCKGTGDAPNAQFSCSYCHGTGAGKRTVRVGGRVEVAREWVPGDSEHGMTYWICIHEKTEDDVFVGGHAYVHKQAIRAAHDDVVRTYRAGTLPREIADGLKEVE